VYEVYLKSAVSYQFVCRLLSATFPYRHYFRTERECDRRQTMMDHLVTRQKQLELTFENRDQRSIQRCGVKLFALCCLSWQHVVEYNENYLFL